MADEGGGPNVGAGAIVVIVILVVAVCGGVGWWIKKYGGKFWAEAANPRVRPAGRHRRHRLEPRWTRTAQSGRRPMMKMVRHIMSTRKAANRVGSRLRATGERD